MASSVASMASQASLTTISTECRLLIYHHLFEDSNLHVYCSEVVRRQHKPHVYILDSDLPKAITQTCRLIRQESVPILWSETTFHFNAAGALDAAILARPRLIPFAKYAKGVHSNGNLRLQKDRYYHVLFESVQVLTIRSILNENERMWSLRSSPDFESYPKSKNGFVTNLQEILKGCTWFPKSMLDKRRRRGKYQLRFDINFPGHLEGTSDVVWFSSTAQHEVSLTPLMQRVLIDYDEQVVLDKLIT